MSPVTPASEGLQVQSVTNWRRALADAAAAALDHTAASSGLTGIASSFTVSPNLEVTGIHSLA